MGLPPWLRGEEAFEPLPGFESMLAELPRAEYSIALPETIAMGLRLGARARDDNYPKV